MTIQPYDASTLYQALLKEKSLTRRQVVTDVFRGNRSQGEIDTILIILEDKDLIKITKEEGATKPITVITWTGVRWIDEDKATKEMQLAGEALKAEDWKDEVSEEIEQRFRRHWWQCLDCHKVYPKNYKPEHCQYCNGMLAQTDEVFEALKRLDTDYV